MKLFFRNSLIISILSISTTTFAQTEKGSLMVGGNLGVSSGGNGSYSVFNANLSPEVGYFLKKNFVVGVELPLTYGSQTIDLTVNPKATYKKYQISALGFSPFVRYYFGEKKLKPFAQTQYAYTYFSEITTQATGDDSNNSGYSAYATVGAGLAYFIAENLSIDAKIDYQIYRSNSSYVFQNQPAFRVGFQIFLPKK